MCGRVYIKTTLATIEKGPRCVVAVQAFAERAFCKNAFLSKRSAEQCAKIA